MNTPNWSDLKTTLPGLYLALASVLASFGVHIPELPSFVVPLLGIIGTIAGAYLTFGVKSAPKVGA